jgi:hypothetical protein
MLNFAIIKTKVIKAQEDRLNLVNYQPFLTLWSKESLQWDVLIFNKRSRFYYVAGSFGYDESEGSP